eukprot:gene46117-62471_t
MASAIAAAEAGAMAEAILAVFIDGIAKREATASPNPPGPLQFCDTSQCPAARSPSGRRQPRPGPRRRLRSAMAAPFNPVPTVTPAAAASAGMWRTLAVAVPHLGAMLGVLVNAGGFAQNQAMRDIYMPGTNAQWSNVPEGDT